MKLASFFNMFTVWKHDFNVTGQALLIETTSLGKETVQAVSIQNFSYFLKLYFFHFPLSSSKTDLTSTLTYQTEATSTSSH